MEFIMKKSFVLITLLMLHLGSVFSYAQNSESPTDPADRYNIIEERGQRAEDFRHDIQKSKINNLYFTLGLVRQGGK